MNLLLLFALATASQSLSTVTTEYDRRDEGRAWNIALAASRLDGVVLRPGASFSFNRAVGPRGLEEGFRPAPELVDGDRVEGIGGGVCQVASTLYAAALEGGLTIVARQAHSRSASYIGPGLDATVSFSRGVDLVLRNDSPKPRTLRAAVLEGRLSVEIQGAAFPGSVRVVEIEVAAHGDGLEATVYRRVDDASATAEREIVSRDRYREPG